MRLPPRPALPLRRLLQPEAPKPDPPLPHSHHKLRRHGLRLLQRHPELPRRQRRPRLCAARDGASQHSFQILIVVIVHRHRGKRALIFEVLFVITGVKPFVDVWRILNGTVYVDAPMDTKNERAGCEVTEIVVESVPSALIQMHDLLGATKLSFATVFSIVMSCLSIATITTSMFLDYDTDASKRSQTPMFYGAVPDSTIRKLLVRVRCVPSISDACTGMTP
jgi:hypothetical protein